MFIWSYYSVYSHYRTRQLVWSPGLVVTTTSRRFLQTALVTSPPACNLQDGGVCVDSGSAYTMKLQAIWLTSAFQSRLHMVVNSCVPRRPEFLWSRTRTSTGRLQWTAYMEQLIGLPAALRSPDLSLCSFKRQLKFYLFPHWRCQVPEQPSDAIGIQRIWRRIINRQTIPRRFNYTCIGFHCPTRLNSTRLNESMTTT